MALGVDNLLAVGRCHSEDFHAICAIRIIRIIGTSMSMGLAAGTAAAMAIDAGVTLLNLDGARLRQQLIKDGCVLDQPPQGYWKKKARISR